MGVWRVAISDAGVITVGQTPGYPCASGPARDARVPLPEAEPGGSADPKGTPRAPAPPGSAGDAYLREADTPLSGFSDFISIRAMQSQAKLHCTNGLRCKIEPNHCVKVSHGGGRE